jgi:hypothetical protein
MWVEVGWREECLSCTIVDFADFGDDDIFGFGRVEGLSIDSIPSVSTDPIKDGLDICWPFVGTPPM